MARRISSIALVALGLVVIALALASATAWRAPETVTAALSADPEAPLVITEPGVLDLLDDEVRVRATAADGSPVLLAVGRTQDVEGWAGDAAHVRVTGLASWTELSTVGPEGGEGEAPSPAGSDMWLVEVTGEGEASLDWTDQEGRHSLLAATDGTSPAPRIELTWRQEVGTPFLVPGLVVGGLLVLLGAALLYLGARKREGASEGAPGGPAVRSRRRVEQVHPQEDESDEAAPGESRSGEDRA